MESKESKYYVELDTTAMDSSELSGSNSPTQYFCRFDPVARRGKLLMLLFDNHGSSAMQEMSRLEVLQMAQKAAVPRESSGDSVRNESRVGKMPRQGQHGPSSVPFQPGVDTNDFSKATFCDVQPTHSRDIRRMENAFSVSSEPSIVIRKQAIFVSAGKKQANAAFS